jgi:hypothetical protein
MCFPDYTDGTGSQPEDTRRAGWPGHDTSHSPARRSRYNHLTMTAERLTSIVRALGILALALMACDVARCEADKARYGTKIRSVEGFVHASSARRVFDELQKILEERGFKMPDAEGEVIGRTLWTEWRGKPAHRISVHITRVKQGQLLVEVREVARLEGEVLDDGRKHDIEWTLIQRLSPKQALEILQRSEERAERTYDSCRGCSSCGRLWLGC